MALMSGGDTTGIFWGKMTFDEKGDLQASTYALWTVRNGRFEQTT
jgi:hypothetical protein